jgi:hypothetical protein
MSTSGFGIVWVFAPKYYGLRRFTAATDTCNINALIANIRMLIMNAPIGTAYSTSVLNRTVDGYTDAQVANTYVTNPDGTRMPIYTRTPLYSQQTAPFGDQVRNLFRNTYSANLTLPLFNGWSGSYNVRAAKLALEEQQLSQDQVRQNLRQKVYKEHNDARKAIQTYIAAKRATQATGRARTYRRHDERDGLPEHLQHHVYLAKPPALRQARHVLQDEARGLLHGTGIELVIAGAASGGPVRVLFAGWTNGWLAESTACTAYVEKGSFIKH